MRSSALRSRFPAAPWGFVGMVALIVVVESFLSVHEIDLLLSIQNQWKTQGIAARREAVEAEILCLGDSLVAQGVIPAVLEARLGRRAYNLGVGGGQFPSHYFLLKRALESGAKPSALVVDALPLQLRITARERVALWAHLLETREAFEIAWLARDAEFLGELFLAKLLPSIRSRLEVRHAILAALKGSPVSNREMNLVCRRNMDQNQGALVLPIVSQGQLNPRHQRWVYPDVLTIDRLNAEAMERFFELAESYKIPVFWLLTPVNSTIQAQAEQLGTDQIQLGFLREVQRRHPGITVVDARKSAYPDATLDDSIHLAYPGAAHFTADLADAIARTLGNAENEPKWVRLPRYRHRPIEFRHEDLAESRKALRK